MSNVVLVVDMVVGFMESGHNLYCGDEARQIIPKVQQLIEREQAAGAEVIFICDTHDPDDLEFQMFPVHCIPRYRGSGSHPRTPSVRRLNTAQAPVQRILRDRPGATTSRPETRKGHRLRRMHRHLRDAHHLGRQKPRLRRGSTHGLRCQLRSRRPLIRIDPHGEDSRRQTGQSRPCGIGPVRLLHTIW